MGWGLQKKLNCHQVSRGVKDIYFEKKIALDLNIGVLYGIVIGKFSAFVSKLASLYSILNLVSFFKRLFFNLEASLIKLFQKYDYNTGWAKKQIFLVINCYKLVKLLVLNLLVCLLTYLGRPLRLVARLTSLIYALAKATVLLLVLDIKFFIYTLGACRAWFEFFFRVEFWALNYLLYIEATTPSPQN